MPFPDFRRELLDERHEAARERHLRRAMAWNLDGVLREELIQNDELHDKALREVLIQNDELHRQLLRAATAYEQGKEDGYRLGLAEGADRGFRRGVEQGMRRWR